ncbi:MAG: TRZ/ATZ family hydrolase, partial [Gammaproteobacteria bacterium]|nr:TRZ/ATZ family hydrolase [Gammaproteobacteria bacterium]
MEPEIDLLISARWIIPVVPEAVTLSNHTVAIADKRIVDILPTDEARQRFPTTPVVDLDHHVLIPGLINAHG